MTAILGFATIFITVLLILKKLMNPLPAFILVPVICAAIGGYGGEISEFIIKGLYIVAPIGIMFIFATLFFGVILTAGTLKPYIHFFCPHGWRESCADLYRAGFADFSGSCQWEWRCHVYVADSSYDSCI